MKCNTGAPYISSLPYMDNFLCAKISFLLLFSHTAASIKNKRIPCKY